MGLYITKVIRSCVVERTKLVHEKSSINFVLYNSSNSSGRKRSREISGIEQHLAQLKRKQMEIDTSHK